MIGFKMDDIPKYRKRKTRKVKKSNHKHEYTKCLLHEKDKEEYYTSEYCEVCGKIGEIKFFETFKNERGFYQCLTTEELLNKHKNLEIKEVDDIFTANYVIQ